MSVRELIARRIGIDARQALLVKVLNDSRVITIDVVPDPLSSLFLTSDVQCDGDVSKCLHVALGVIAGVALVRHIYMLPLPRHKVKAILTHD